MKTASEWRSILMQTAFRPAGMADEIEWGNYIEKWIKAAQDDARAELTIAADGDAERISDLTIRADKAESERDQAYLREENTVGICKSEIRAMEEQVAATQDVVADQKVKLDAATSLLTDANEHIVQLERALVQARATLKIADESPKSFTKKQAEVTFRIIHAALERKPHDTTPKQAPCLDLRCTICHPRELGPQIPPCPHCGSRLALTALDTKGRPTVYTCPRCRPSEAEVAPQTLEAARSSVKAMDGAGFSIAKAEAMRCPRCGGFMDLTDYGSKGMLPRCERCNIHVEPPIVDRFPGISISDKHINIDGMDHGPECGQCSDRVCDKCKVFFHVETIYDGFVYICPECGDSQI